MNTEETILGICNAWKTKDCQNSNNFESTGHTMTEDIPG